MPFNRPAAPTEQSAAKRARPRVWSEGRQRSRLNLRAYARVSLLLARQMARPLLLASTRFCAVAADAIAENRLGPWLARASRLGRALPSRDSAARVIAGTGALLSVAADVAASPAPAEPEPVSPPLLIARRIRLAELNSAFAEPPPSPEPPRPCPTEASDLDAPTLAAIRALIAEARVPSPVIPVRPSPKPQLPPSGRVLLTHGVPLNPPEPRRPTLAETVAAQAHHLLAGLFAATLTLVMLPAGLVKAALLHLNGDDLRKWH